MKQFKKFLYKRFKDLEALERMLGLKFEDQSPQSTNKNLLSDYHLVGEYKGKKLHVFYILDRKEHIFVTRISCDEYSCEEGVCIVN